MFTLNSRFHASDNLCAPFQRLLDISGRLSSCSQVSELVIVNWDLKLITRKTLEQYSRMSPNLEVRKSICIIDAARGC